MAAPERLVLPDRIVDLAQGIVLTDEGTDRLTTKETELLRYLAGRPGEVIRRDDLLAQVWGYQPAAVTRAVDNMMRKLRAKIEIDPSDPKHLLTVFGEGYRYLPPEEIHRPPPPPGEPPVDPVGRAALVREILDRIGAGERWITLTGAPGIGKTTVALAVAAHAARERTIWTCTLADATDAPALRRLVIRALEATEGGLLPTLRSAGTCLLVLDGCETLGADALTELEGWLGAAPQLGVLATSRVRLGAAADALVEVPPLAAEPAEAMLRAQILRAGVSVRGDLGPLLDRLEGWPLAIELAAARLRVLDVETVTARLDASFDLLRAPGPTAGRTSSLDAAIRSSFDALDPVAQSVLARCSVFRGGFVASAAEAVARDADQALDALHRLVDHSLLRRSPDGRLAPLDAIRAFAAARLREAGEEEEAREAHFRWCLALAVASDTPPIDDHQAAVRAEWDNLLAALEHGRRVDPAGAAKITSAMTLIAGRRGHNVLKLQLYRAALAAGPPAPVAIQLRSGIQHTKLGLGEQLDDPHHALIREAEAAGDPLALARCLTIASYWTLLQEGDAPEAEAAVRRARDLASTDEGHGIHCWVDLALAATLQAQSRYEEAVEVYLAARERTRRARDSATGAEIAWNLGMIELHLGRPDAAEVHLREALRLSAVDPLASMRASTTQLLGQLALDRDQIEEARALHAQAETLVQRAGSSACTAFQLTLMGEICLLEGDFAGAVSSWEREVALWQRQRATSSVHALGQLGAALALAGRHERAREVLGTALGLAQSEPVRHEITAMLAAACADLDDLDAALAHLAQAEPLQQGPPPSRALREIALAHIALARARASHGEMSARHRADARAHHAAALATDRSVLTRVLARGLAALLAASGG